LSLVVRRSSFVVRRSSFVALLVLAILVPFIGVRPASAQANATYTVGKDRNDQTTIIVTGAGASVTLAQIRQGLGKQAALLEDQGNGVWLLNANLLIDRGVTLTLSQSAGVRQLRLRSRPSAKSPPAGEYDYGSFTYLRTEDGVITIDGVQIHSWDTAANTFDTDFANGRAYILAKYDARLDISNSELSYLGSGDGESYGVSWRDTNSTAEPDKLRTRVTGQVTNSLFHHNYYGVYTYQAADMVFRGNKFYQNIRYGFDPHDYTINVLVEDNQAYENGSHGFIISRGCTKFVFRRNVAFRNNDPDPKKFAHGFMLDPGSPNSDYPQVPSTENVLENNHAYDNEGYGLRILGSTNNIVRSNLFERNEQGVTVEQNSTGNTLEGNTITGSRVHGIFLRGGGDQTTVKGNTISGSGTNGIYVKSSGNTISANTVSGNQGFGIGTLPETTPEAAVADLQRRGARLTVTQIDAELLGVVVAESALEGNRITGNTVTANVTDGIELKGALKSVVEGNKVENNGVHGIYLANGASGNQVKGNTVAGNQGNGIRANGEDVTKNTWSENLVFGNIAGGIQVTSGAQGGIKPPTITGRQGNQVSGKAMPGARVELFSDTGAQGRHFEGHTTAGGDGAFILTITGHAPNLSATTTDSNGNSSAFSENANTTRMVYLPLTRR
jgi:parallel beta-helix repeat protein